MYSACEELKKKGKCMHCKEALVFSGIYWIYIKGSYQQRIVWDSKINGVELFGWMHCKHLYALPCIKCYNLRLMVYISMAFYKFD